MLEVGLHIQSNFSQLMSNVPSSLEKILILMVQKKTHPAVNRNSIKRTDTQTILIQAKKINQ